MTHAFSHSRFLAGAVRLKMGVFIAVVLLLAFSQTISSAQTQYYTQDDFFIHGYSTAAYGNWYHVGRNDVGYWSDEIVQGASYGIAGWPIGGAQHLQYTSNIGYIGSDTVVYRTCGPIVNGQPVCTNASTVVLLVIGNYDGQNFGACRMRTNKPQAPMNQGDPVNVTNGNMWLQHTDYRLPGPGEAIEINRFYNSKSEETGLFGYGWTTAYDESLTVYDDRMVRVDLADGKAVFFGRTNTSTNTFHSASPGFFDQLTKNGDNTWTLNFQDGRVHKFSASGALEWLKDRNENQTTLGYS